MPLKDEEKRRGASKARMQKMRKGVTKQGVTDEGVTQYPPIIYALTDPVKREKLEDIYLSLKTFKQEQNVYLGCGKYSMPFDVVGDLLEATN